MLMDAYLLSCSTTKLFNILADLVSWIAEQAGVSCICHYINDFLIIGPPHSLTCKQNTHISLCNYVTTLAFCQLQKRLRDHPLPSLSLISPWIQPEWRLNSQKTSSLEYRLHLNTGLQKEGCKVRIIVGLLQHATKVVKCRRTFTAQMYATAAKLKELHFFTRLNKKFRSDLACFCPALEWLKYFQNPKHTYLILPWSPSKRMPQGHEAAVLFITIDGYSGNLGFNRYVLWLKNLSLQC